MDPEPDPELQALLDSLRELEASNARTRLISQLHRAIRQGDRAQVKELCAGDEARKLEPGERAQILTGTVSSDDASEEMLSLLLASGFPAHCVDDHLGSYYQKTPFMAAARAGRLDLAMLLLKAGADPHWKNPQGANAASAVLPSSSVQDRCEPTPERAAVGAWLEELGVRMDLSSEDSKSKLFYASYAMNSWQDIPGHLAHGIDPGCLRWTPFMLAVALGTTTADEAARLTPAEQRHRDAWERTPFLLAVVAGRRDLAGALVRGGADPLTAGRCETNALHFAARENHAALIPWLLSLGCGIDTPDEFGDTALNTAAAHDHLNAVHALLKEGAAIKAVREGRDAVIHSAGSLEVMRALLDAGANVNSVSGCGHWPLSIAASRGEGAFVKFLLDAGADPNLNSSGETALFDAVRGESFECVRLLLDAGANINAQDCDGWTCLWYVKSGPMARYLTGRGADPSIPDQIGEMPETGDLAPEVAAIFRKHRLQSAGGI